MNKIFLIVILLIFIFTVGCSEKEDLSSIHHVQYDIEDLCFKDTVLNYDFNRDQRDDFFLILKWSIDTSAYNYNLDTDYNYGFYELLGSYSNTFIFEERAWRVGDMVVKSNSPSWIQATSGGDFYGTNGGVSFNAHLDSLKNTDIYWAFYLESNGITHYGWLQWRCSLIEEFAINLNPEEPILIGQRD